MRRREQLASTESFERGAALMIVIWVVTLLFMLFAVQAQRIGAEIDSVARETGRTEAEELARRGFEAAVARLLADDNDWDAPSEGWAGKQQAAVGKGRWSVRVEDEGSKFNLNSFSGPLIRVLPGMDDDRLASFLDWRDMDDDIRAGGAERGYYLGETAPGEPRNGRLEVSEELGLIKGFADLSATELAKLSAQATVYGPLNVHVMDPDAFEALLVARGFGSTASRLKQDLLVHRAMSPPPPASLESFREALASFTRSDLDKVAGDLTADGTINVNTASVEVLRALAAGLGISKEAMDRLIQTRGSGQAFSSIPQLAAALGDEAAYQKVLGYLTVRSRVFAVMARGVSASGQRAGFRAIVRRERDDAGVGLTYGESGASPVGDASWRLEVLSWQWLDGRS